MLCVTTECLHNKRDFVVVVVVVILHFNVSCLSVCSSSSSSRSHQLSSVRKKQRRLSASLGLSAFIMSTYLPVFTCDYFIVVHVQLTACLISCLRKATNNKSGIDNNNNALLFRFRYISR